MANASQFVVEWAGGEIAAAGVSTALAAVGITEVAAPVLAVIVVVGHVVVQGATRLVRKKFQVCPEQRAHLEQLNLTGTHAPDHFTVMINGAGAKKGQYNAFASPTDNHSYALISTGHLKGLSKLIGGSMKCNVRDMGGYTSGATTPFSVRISMPDVLALMRQSWVYERFCQTKCGSMTVVVLCSQTDKTKLRVAWENSGSPDNTKAMVYTAIQWKKTPYAGKTKTMPERVADVDIAIEKTLVFE